ncbi:hypothetical protein ACWXVV_02955 [Mycoplasma sp. 3392]
MTTNEENNKTEDKAKKLVVYKYIHFDSCDYIKLKEDKESEYKVHDLKDNIYYLTNSLRKFITDNGDNKEFFKRTKVINVLKGENSYNGTEYTYHYEFRLERYITDVNFIVIKATFDFPNYKIDESIEEAQKSILNDSSPSATREFLFDEENHDYINFQNFLINNVFAKNFLFRNSLKEEFQEWVADKKDEKKQNEHNNQLNTILTYVRNAFTYAFVYVNKNVTKDIESINDHNNEDARMMAWNFWNYDPGNTEVLANTKEAIITKAHSIITYFYSLDETKHSTHYNIFESDYKILFIIALVQKWGYTQALNILDDLISSFKKVKSSNLGKNKNVNNKLVDKTRSFDALKIHKTLSTLEFGFVSNDNREQHFYERLYSDFYIEKIKKEIHDVLERESIIDSLESRIIVNHDKIDQILRDNNRFIRDIRSSRAVSTLSILTNVAVGATFTQVSQSFIDDNYPNLSYLKWVISCSIFAFFILLALIIFFIMDRGNAKVLLSDLKESSKKAVELLLKNEWLISDNDSESHKQKNELVEQYKNYLDKTKRKRKIIKAAKCLNVDYDKFKASCEKSLLILLKRQHDN